MGKKVGRCTVHALLRDLINQHAGRRQDGERAGHGTYTTRAETLHASFRTLRRIGYKIKDPKNLGDKHVKALCIHWHDTGIGARTINKNLSVLRIFCEWIGKKGMVRSLREYLPNIPEEATSAVAEKTKSWTGNGIDVMQKMHEAAQLDATFGVLLEMALAFGLRREEAVCIKPHEADKGSYLTLTATKGGRPRIVPIDTPEQRAVLNRAKASVRKTHHLAWQKKENGEVATLDYSLQRYSRCLAKIGITRKDAGVTGHGLRAQFAENAFLKRQVIPPTLGGIKDQMKKDALDTLRGEVSEHLGHSRIGVTSSYVSSFGRKSTLENVARTKANIEAALPYCLQQAIPLERQKDCAHLHNELQEIGVALSKEGAHFLWQRHSQRHASDWIALYDKNIAAIEEASLSLYKQIQQNHHN